MDRVSTDRQFMPTVRREPEGSVLAYSTGDGIGRAVVCWIEGSCPKDSPLVPPHRCHLFQFIEAGLIF